jgi:hypothetical protein
MGDGVNIAARLEGIAAPGAICLSEDAYRQVSGRLDMDVTDLGPTQLKNIEKIGFTTCLSVASVTAAAKRWIIEQFAPLAVVRVGKTECLLKVGRRNRALTVSEESGNLRRRMNK